MQIRIISPQRIRATIQLPSSKSISNRALIIHALSQGTFTPENLSDCDDTRVMVRALAAAPGTPIDIQAAGTAMRFLTAYLSVTSGSRLITGTQRMQQRPIRVLVDALRTLGADIAYAGNEGFPPLRITGRRLTKGCISLPGNISSQYISALLMIGPSLEEGLAMELTGDIVSRPYINLTLQLMNDFGAQARWTDDCHLKVDPVPYRSVSFCVESDWSAASYWYQITALAGDASVVLPGLFARSYQGDSKVEALFRPLGVETRHDGDTVILSKVRRTATRMDYDFVDQPDLAQTFVVTCALLGIPFRFIGLQSLKIKETDRIAALIREMQKLGYTLVESDGSVLAWDGTRTAPTGEAIDTYEDHRMAMAFAPACLVLPDVRINHPEVVTKSYPRYWDDLVAAGFTIEEEGEPCGY